tara:strand:+ start:849 stop:1223 length:375 start_codon:yes stop_codon:yes gene_type:complete
MVLSIKEAFTKCQMVIYTVDRAIQKIVKNYTIFQNFLTRLRKKQKMPNPSILSREQASQASMILENSVFKETLQNLSNRLISEWTIADTVEERELCWMKLNALSSVKEDLQALIHNDKIENGEN